MSAASASATASSVAAVGGGEVQQAPAFRPDPVFENAVLHQHLDRMIRRLQERPELVNGHNELHSPPLILAAMKGRSAGARFLLDRGADPNFVDDEGLTALYWAYRFGHSQLAEMLLDAGADPCLGLSTPLMAFAFRGEVDLAQEWLTSNRANCKSRINAVDNNGLSALHHAGTSFKAYPVMVRLLLTQGADPTIKDKWGQTSLSVARQRNYRNVARILEEAINQQIDYVSKICQLNMDYHRLDQVYRSAKARNEKKRKCIATAPIYLKDRVTQQHHVSSLPKVEISNYVPPADDRSNPVEGRRRRKKKGSSSSNSSSAAAGQGGGGGGGGGGGEGESPEEVRMAVAYHALGGGLAEDIWTELYDMLVPKLT